LCTALALGLIAAVVMLTKDYSFPQQIFFLQISRPSLPNSAAVFVTDEFITWLVCCAVLSVMKIPQNITTWCIDEVKRVTTSTLSTGAIAMMSVCTFLAVIF